MKISVHSYVHGFYSAGSEIAKHQQIDQYITKDKLQNKQLKQANISADSIEQVEYYKSKTQSLFQTTDHESQNCQVLIIGQPVPIAWLTEKEMRQWYLDLIQVLDQFPKIRKISIKPHPKQTCADILQILDRPIEVVDRPLDALANEYDIGITMYSSAIMHWVYLDQLAIAYDPYRITQAMQLQLQPEVTRAHDCEQLTSYIHNFNQSTMMIET